MIKPFYITQPYYYAGHSPVYNYPFIIEQWRYLDSTVDKRITTESNKYISN